MTMTALDHQCLALASKAREELRQESRFARLDESRREFRQMQQRAAARSPGKPRSAAPRRGPGTVLARDRRGNAIVSIGATNATLGRKPYAVWREGVEFANSIADALRPVVSPEMYALLRGDAPPAPPPPVRPVLGLRQCGLATGRRSPLPLLVGR